MIWSVRIRYAVISLDSEVLAAATACGAALDTLHIVSHRLVSTLYLMRA